MPAKLPRKRIRHYDNGSPRSLTFSCYQRRPYLANDQSRAWMVRGIELARERHGLRLWAYVIMPEHVHLLIWPRENSRMSDILSTMKQSVAKRARLRWGKPDTEFSFWQRGPGYDRNLWDLFEVWKTIEYLHLNPVRRHLCRRPEQWRWSSATDFLGTGTGPLRLDLDSLPRS